jgi:hypothetical protein
MTDGVGSRFLPDHLSAVPDRWHEWLRPLWLVVLALTFVLVAAGTIYTLRDAYVNDFQFARLGLTSEIENDGSVTIHSQVMEVGRKLDLPSTSRIVAIDGKVVPRDTRVWELAELLRRPDGATVALTIRTEDGRQLQRRLAANPDNLFESDKILIARDVRIGMRLAMSLITCFALIACAALLFRRRARDPVALLLSFSFLMFAGTIDPPLVMWLAIGLGDLFDVYSTAAWVLLVIALATFPDGKFLPRALRWLLVLTPLIAISLAIDETPMELAAGIAFVLPLGLIASHVAKYRRFEPGIERQQLKWAAFGFAVGLVLLMIAFMIVASLPETGFHLPVWGLVVLILFEGGFLAMAVGLLVSLIRFRLWEADRVISKSAVAGAVTLIVGILWTLSIDVVKTVVEFSLGQESPMIATVVGAILAAGIFAPTQAVAQRWANKRLGNDRDKIASLTPRLVAWRATERPDEIGQRTLASLAASAHISAGAILVDTPRGRSLLAARDVMYPELLAEPGANPEGDGRFVLKLPLEDEDGPVGLLLLGPRSDYNRYNSDELEGLRAVTEPIAEALRGAQRRSREVDSMQRTLSTVEERLARLEGGGGQAKPA